MLGVFVSFGDRRDGQLPQQIFRAALFNQRDHFRRIGHRKRRVPLGSRRHETQEGEQERADCRFRDDIAHELSPNHH